VQTGARTHNDNASSLLLALHVVHGQGSSVDHAVQVDVQRSFVRFLKLARSISLEFEVVGAWPDASVGEDKVNPAMFGDSGLEECGKVLPLSNIRLNEGEGAEGWWGLDVCADYCCTEGLEEFNCRKTDAG
jgi:hypothetical protein